MTDCELNRIWYDIVSDKKVEGWDGRSHGALITLVDVAADTLYQRDAEGGEWEMVPKTGAGA